MRARRLADGSVEFNADNLDGSDVAIEASRDLSGWTILTNLLQGTGSARVTDSSAPS